MKLTIIRLAYLLVGFIFITNSPATAQEDTTFSDTGFWFQGGMGIAGGTVGDIAYDIGATVSFHGVWTIRAISASTRDDYSPDKLESISIMYGLPTHTKHVMAMISAGPSHTRFSTKQVSGGTIGLVIEGEIMSRPIQIFGFGFRLSQNFNVKRSYTSAGFFLVLGVLWQ